jgi:hypothetical protein
MYPNPQDVIPLPARPNLEQYKKQAKDLVRACRTGAADTFRAWAARWPDHSEQIERFARETLTSRDCAAKCALISTFALDFTQRGSTAGCTRAISGIEARVMWRASATFTSKVRSAA